MNTRNKKIFIGLIEVFAGEGNSLLDRGTIAFVNVLAIAENEEEFNFKVKEAISYYGLTLKKIEDVELLEERKKYFEVSDELLDLADNLNDKVNLRFGTFHTFINE